MAGVPRTSILDGDRSIDGTAQKDYRHHAVDRSMPTDQQGLGRAKVDDKMIDQQGAGCPGNPAQSEDGTLKAQLQIHTDFPAC